MYRINSSNYELYQGRHQLNSFSSDAVYKNQSPDYGPWILGYALFSCACN